MFTTSTCIVSTTSSGIDSSGDMDNDSNKITCDFVNSNTSFVHVHMFRIIA